MNTIQGKRRGEYVCLSSLFFLSFLVPLSAELVPLELIILARQSREPGLGRHGRLATLVSRFDCLSSRLMSSFVMIE